MRAVESQEKAIRPIRVAPSASRVRKAKIAAKTSGGKTKAPKTKARLEPSLRGIKPSCNALCMAEPTPKARKASGNGLASGRRTILVTSSISHCRSLFSKRGSS
jgi:hypothetical protein